MAAGAGEATSGAHTGGAALERLILDTTILISAERSAGAIEEVVADGDDVVIAAITAAELLVGIELADRRHRPARQAFVESLLSLIAVEPYDLRVARVHASLLAHTRAAGRARRPHDLLIAATASTHGRTVGTADSTGFTDLPGVTVRQLGVS